MGGEGRKELELFRFFFFFLVGWLIHFISPISSDRAGLSLRFVQGLVCAQPGPLVMNDDDGACAP